MGHLMTSYKLHYDTSSLQTRLLLLGRIRLCLVPIVPTNKRKIFTRTLGGNFVAKHFGNKSDIWEIDCGKMKGITLAHGWAS